MFLTRRVLSRVPSAAIRPTAIHRNKMTDNKTTTTGAEKPAGERDESEWRAILSPAQFAILREKGTERPDTGEYNHFEKTGEYDCAGCGQPLYRSTTKFNSGCGWPAFYEGLPGAITTQTDTSLGRVRTEIMCSNCGGHLGHVFKGEGFKTPTDERHCVNSISLKFKPE